MRKYLELRSVGFLLVVPATVVAVLLVSLGCGSDTTGPAAGDRLVSSRTAAGQSAVNVSPDPPQNRYQYGLEPVGELISWTEGPTFAQECVFYEYGKSNVLVLIHQFTIWTSGIFDWSLDVTLVDGIITITETYEGGYLPMVTGQEIVMEISHLRQDVYTVILTNGMGTVEFTVDLINEPSGQICFDQ